MIDRIEPALSEREWAARHVDQRLEIRLEPHSGHLSVTNWGALQNINCEPSDLPALIALANAALPDNDPRKITRDRLFSLREVVANFEAHYTHEDEMPGAQRYREYAADARGLLEALAAYLPPEGL